MLRGINIFKACLKNGLRCNLTISLITDLINFNT
jgi:hypothetical protein